MSIALFKEPLPEPMSFKTIELISQQSITSHVVPPHCHNHQPFVHDCKNNGQNSRFTSLNINCIKDYPQYKRKNSDIL